MSSGTETRQLTEGVYVRFTPDDLDVIRGEAERRDMSVAQLLRENTLRDLGASPQVKIVPPDAALFDAGVQLYAGRADKDWPLTDCISFVVMTQERIVEALTGDRHFEQAGFTALLK